ncbi:MAG: 2,5-diamino-6-(ribosylamino)-4(3H)-pyrimidinone 5'-phosphate reductase, partial [Thermoprotei archaeon]
MSVDGKIASRSGESRLSCPFDKKRLHELRAMSDGVMVGANTVKIDDPLLTPRLVQVEKPPARIVVDGKLTLTPTYRVFKVKDAPTYLITSSKTPESKLRKFEDIGVNVIKAPEKDGEVNLNYALSELYGKGIKHILVEGGGNLIWSLLKQNL